MCFALSILLTECTIVIPTTRVQKARGKIEGNEEKKRRLALRIRRLEQARSFFLLGTHLRSDMERVAAGEVSRASDGKTPAQHACRRREKGRQEFRVITDPHCKF